MILQILNPENYFFNGYALPMFIVGTAIILLGLFILIGEHGSRIGSSFLFMCLSIGFYYFATGANFASRGEGMSLLWIRISQLGADFIPTTILLSTVDRLNLRHRYRFAVASSFVLSTLITFGAFFTDLHVKGSAQFFWGRNVQYGPLGIVFMTFFFSIMVFVLHLYWLEYRQSSTVQQKKRLKGLLIAFNVGYLGAVDFLPCLGLHVYPFGYLPVGFFILVSAYIIMRYRFTDITPELAADRILETMQSAVIVIDLKGKIRVTSQVTEEMLGYQKSELLDRDIGSILPALAEFNTAALLSGKSSSHETAWHSRSGQRFNVIVSVSTITNSLDNSPVGIVYAAYDITQRRQVEEALQVSEAKFRLLVDNAYEGILVAREGMLLYVNPQMIHLSGYTYEELTARPFVEFVDPDDRPLVLEHHIKRMKGEIDPEEVYSFRIVRKDGAIRWLETKGAIITWDNKPANLNLVSDITERKQAVEALRQSKETLQRIMDSSSAVISAKDLEGKYIFINALYEKLFHVSNSEILGKTDYDIFPRIVADAFRDVDLQTIKAGMPIEAEEAVPQDDGMHYYISLKFPLYDSNKKPYAVCGMSTDITERKKLGEQSMKSQKLESIGTLAGGIAHDFNNLLQGVFGYISLAKITANNKEKSAAALEQAEKALHQTVNLTTQLLTFSKGGKPFKKKIDLGPIIENSANFMLSGSRSDLRLNIAADLWQVEADEGQIGQVVQNIVLNADQAMPVGGTVRVTAANMAKGDASLRPGLAKGDYIVIAIHDTGVGIPEQYLSKIFDPYFTTKEKGSGLGLATSYTIVKNHGGIIDVMIKYGEGTTFMIYLPAIVGQVRLESEEKKQELSPSGKARVLVMDDEEVIRNLSSELLGVLGHEVEVAKHGEEVLEKYRGAIGAGRPFDIVILDITIRGGMGGVETVQQLLKMDSNVKAVVSSGYSDDMTIANYMSQGFKACLKKPYDVVALRKVLSKMVNV